MAEKLTASITFKCTDEEKADLRNKSKAHKKKLSILIRDICKLWLSSESKKQVSINEISIIEEQLNSLITHINLARDTRDTSFELTPPPKPQAQKKPNCWNQLSLNCQTTAKQ